MSIIGKFLKIAGKDPNGNAKGVAVTENGEVKVQQVGSIVKIDQISSGEITINAGATATIIEDYNFSDGKVNKFKMNWYGNMNDDANCEMKVFFTNKKGDYGTALGYVFTDNVSMIKGIGWTAYTDDVYVRGKYMKIEVINNDDSDKFYRRFTIINNMPKGDK